MYKIHTSLTLLSIIFGVFFNMMTEDKQKERYELTGNASITWYSSAKSLLAAAKILDKNHVIDFNTDVQTDEEQLLPSVLLLIAFALECLFKALWLETENKPLVKDGKYIGISGVGSHKLHEMADKANFELDDKERNTLINMSIIMTSVGRYPIPKNFNDAKIQKFRDGSQGTRTILSSSDLDISKKIIKRILDKSKIPFVDDSFFIKHNHIKI